MKTLTQVREVSEGKGRRVGVQALNPVSLKNCPLEPRSVSGIGFRVWGLGFRVQGFSSTSFEHLSPNHL